MALAAQEVHQAHDIVEGNRLGAIEAAQVDPTGRWIVTANYRAGSVGVVPIEKDGTLGPRGNLVTLTGEPGPGTSPFICRCRSPT
jgi:6-phosphogluconolactonase (cycloisomerase 2 family)